MRLLDIGKFALILIAISNQGSASSPNRQNVSFGGFISNGFLETSHYNYLANTDEGTFDFFEAALNVSWTPAKRTTVNGQAFIWELGPYGNYEPLIDYLFVDYNHSKEFGIRVGRIKRELGLYTHIQDIDISRTSIILPHGVYDPRYRAFSASLDGAALYGTFDLPRDQRFSYYLYAGAVEPDFEGGIAGYSLTSVSRQTFDNKIDTLQADGNLGVQLWYYPNIEGLRLGYGLSSYKNVEIATRGTVPTYYPNPLLAGNELLSRTRDMSWDLSQVSLEYFVGHWTFTSEYYQSITDLIFELSVDDIPVSATREAVNFDVWYASIARRFGDFEVALTYSDTPPDPQSPDEGIAAFQRDTQVSLRYDATDNWTLKLELHSIEGTKRLFNQYGQNPVLDHRNWTLWAAKSTFTF